MSAALNITMYFVSVFQQNHQYNHTFSPQRGENSYNVFCFNFSTKSSIRFIQSGMLIICGQCGEH